MKRFLLTLLIAGYCSVSFLGNTAVFDYTYANGELGNYGKGKKERIDVAMRLSDPKLVGMKLVGFKAYLSTTSGIGSTSMWLSGALNLENNVNVPDIAEYDVTPMETILEENNFGLLEINLPEPYILTSEPVYLGYSFEVVETDTPEQKRPIVISDDINPDGFFLHMSKSVLDWMEYSERANGVAYIVAVIEGNTAENAVDFKGYEKIYAEENQDYYATFTVSNEGLNSVETLKYVYNYDNGGEAREGFVVLPVPLPSSMTNEYSIALEFESIPDYGRYELSVEIIEVNGMPNEGTLPQITAYVNVIPFKPVHRPLVEEYTGLWCGWCPRGYIAMEMLAEEYGDREVSICYHDGDEMSVITSYPVNVLGLPASSVDRQGVVDPYYGSYGNNVEFGISLDMLNAADELSIASIDLNATLEDNQVLVETNTVFIETLVDADYEIGYVLICNGLSDPVWLQSNYYSGLPGYEGTPLEVLTTWLPIVPGLVFNDVAVDVKGMLGVPQSIPASIEPGKRHIHNYTFDIEGNELIQNKNNLVVAGFIIDKTTGKIINSNKCIVRSSEINTLDPDSYIISTEFYDLTGKKLSGPSSGIVIKMEKYSDGVIKTKKLNF